jgi:uncharacterized protein YdeI (YjbR/CyaY-like superfamily)
MKKSVQNTQEYITLYPKWEKQLNDLKVVIEEFELDENIKWGAPCYTYKGKNVVGLAGFKNHCAAWFHKGALISGSEELLQNAQPGKTKLLRQLRFRESEHVNTQLFRNLVKEAIEIEKTQSKLTIQTYLPTICSS